MAWLASPRFPRHDGFCHDGLSDSRQTNRPPKKPSQSRANAARAHPLVDPGDPSNSPTTQATTHQPSLHHCMVAMATRPPGRRSRGAFQTQITTVMLGMNQLVYLKSGLCDGKMLFV